MPPLPMMMRAPARSIHCGIHLENRKLAVAVTAPTL
jgi:hypothetical protein